MISAKYERRQLQVLLRRASLRDLSASDKRTLGEGVRDGAEKIRQRVVRNVSGYPVSYTGGSFVVRVRTGALKASIEVEWPYLDEWSARVFVNGTHTSITNVGGFPGKPVPVSKYAAAVERGHKEIDLKKTMQGKIVPFFGSRSSSTTGPYTERGLERGLVSIGKRQYISKNPDPKRRKPLVYKAKRTATGGAYFITFRRVGKKGWIIPAAKPRPFMDAGAAQSTTDVRRAVGRKLRVVLASGEST